MSVYEALSVMIQFGIWILALISLMVLYISKRK